MGRPIPYHVDGVFRWGFFFCYYPPRMPFAYLFWCSRGSREIICRPEFSLGYATFTDFPQIWLFFTLSHREVELGFRLIRIWAGRKEECDT
jgi:hypothetical protein